MKVTSNATRHVEHAGYEQVAIVLNPFRCSRERTASVREALATRRDAAQVGRLKRVAVDVGRDNDGQTEAAVPVLVPDAAVIVVPERRGAVRRRREPFARDAQVERVPAADFRVLCLVGAAVVVEGSQHVLVGLEGCAAGHETAGALTGWRGHQLVGAGGPPSVRVPAQQSEQAASAACPGTVLLEFIRKLDRVHDRRDEGELRRCVDLTSVERWWNTAEKTPSDG